MWQPDLKVVVGEDDRRRPPNAVQRLLDAVAWSASVYAIAVIIVRAA
jgi:hypothetical protein